MPNLLFPIAALLTIFVAILSLVKLIQGSKSRFDQAVLAVNSCTVAWTFIQMNASGGAGYGFGSGLIALILVAWPASFLLSLIWLLSLGTSKSQRRAQQKQHQEVGP